MNHEKTEEIIVDVARIIWKHEITITHLYEALGADLETYRLDADVTVSKIAGILTGWESAPEE